MSEDNRPHPLFENQFPPVNPKPPIEVNTLIENSTQSLGKWQEGLLQKPDSYLVDEFKASLIWLQEESDLNVVNIYRDDTQHHFDTTSGERDRAKRVVKILIDEITKRTVYWRTNEKCTEMFNDLLSQQLIDEDQVDLLRKDLQALSFLALSYRIMKDKSQYEEHDEKERSLTINAEYANGLHLVQQTLIVASLLAVMGWHAGEKMRTDIKLVDQTGLIQERSAQHDLATPNPTHTRTSTLIPIPTNTSTPTSEPTKTLAPTYPTPLPTGTPTGLWNPTPTAEIIEIPDSAVMRQTAIAIAPEQKSTLIESTNFTKENLERIIGNSFAVFISSKPGEEPQSEIGYHRCSGGFVANERGDLFLVSVAHCFNHLMDAEGELSLSNELVITKPEDNSISRITVLDVLRTQPVKNDGAIILKVDPASIQIPINPILISQLVTDGNEVLNSNIIVSGYPQTIYNEGKISLIEGNISSIGGTVTYASGMKLSNSMAAYMIAEGGESGSLVYAKKNGEIIVVGVHAGNASAIISLNGQKYAPTYALLSYFPNSIVEQMSR